MIKLIFSFHWKTLLLKSQSKSQFIQMNKNNKNKKWLTMNLFQLHSFNNSNHKRMLQLNRKVTQKKIIHHFIQKIKKKYFQRYLLKTELLKDKKLLRIRLKSRESTSIIMQLVKIDIETLKLGLELFQTIEE